jgi:hypothetical protein
VGHHQQRLRPLDKVVLQPQHWGGGGVCVGGRGGEVRSGRVRGWRQEAEEAGSKGLPACRAAGLWGARRRDSRHSPAKRSRWLVGSSSSWGGGRHKGGRGRARLSTQASAARRNRLLRRGRLPRPWAPPPAHQQVGLDKERPRQRDAHAPAAAERPVRGRGRAGAAAMRGGRRSVQWPRALFAPRPPSLRWFDQPPLHHPTPPHHPSPAPLTLSRAASCRNRS